MNSKHTISVLMCVYNGQEYLSEAVQSILNQTYTEYEFIIVDDGSSDESLKILAGFQDKRIKVIPKDHTGLTDSLNKGLAFCNGRWVARLDSDDIAMSERLEKQAEYIALNPGTILLGSGCFTIDGQSNIIEKYTYPHKHDDIMRHLEGLNSPFPHPSAIFQKKVALNIGGYNRRFVKSQDIDLWLRLSSYGEIACIKEPLIKLRKHSLCVSNEQSGKLQFVFAIAALICHFRRKLGYEDLSEMGDDTWDIFLKWIEEQLEKKGWFNAIGYWNKFGAIWHSKDINRILKAVNLGKELALSTSAQRAFLLRFEKKKIILQLTEESIPLFQP
jgi:glycosyltransferase involved in cell wall biosynthesis